MNLERWGDRGKKELIQIASVGHLNMTGPNVILNKKNYRTNFRSPIL